MPTSFISEHSAEFVLVPAFARILAEKWKKVVPVYFWRTREGSKMGRACDRGRQIRVVAMYARRPKVTSPDDGRIQVKLNRELFLHADYLNAHGIPVFAGAPRVSSLLELQLDTPCSWFVLLGAEHEVQDQEFTLDVVTGDVMNNGLSDAWRPVADHEIHDFVTSRTMPWNDVADVITSREWEEGSLHRSSSFFGGFGTYKPVYFLLQDN